MQKPFLMDNREVFIRTREVSKRYGVKTALRFLSMNVSEGEVVGVLGVNGAGWVEVLKYFPGGYYLLNTIGRGVTDNLHWRIILIEMRNDFLWVILFLLLGPQAFRRMHLTTAQ